MIVDRRACPELVEGRPRLRILEPLMIVDRRRPRLRILEPLMIVDRRRPRLRILDLRYHKTAIAIFLISVIRGKSGFRLKDIKLQKAMEISTPDFCVC
jgi:hypothetical protein